MSWKVKISSVAEKYYKTLDKKLRRRIKESTLSLSQYENPLEHSQVKGLTADLKGFYRLRVGKYRIIFALLEKKELLLWLTYSREGKHIKHLAQSI